MKIIVDIVIVLQPNATVKLLALKISKG